MKNWLRDQNNVKTIKFFTSLEYSFDLGKIRYTLPGSNDALHHCQIMRVILTLIF